MKKTGFRTAGLRVLRVLAVLAVWLAVWEAFAYAVGLTIVLPTVEETASEFFRLLASGSFYLSCALSLLRILCGYLLGVLLGLLFSFLSVRAPFLRDLFSPAMTVIRSTPVASFILVLWVLIGSENVPVAIAVLMVLPVIYQNITDGHAATDPALIEVCRVYGIRGMRRFRLLTLPTLLPYLIPALTAGAGFAWKAGVAAEIICYTKKSIGQEIYLAKNSFESARMFAFTIAVILLSVALEKSVRLLGKGVLSRARHGTHPENLR